MRPLLRLICVMLLSAACSAWWWRSWLVPTPTPPAPPLYTLLYPACMPGEQPSGSLRSSLATVLPTPMPCGPTFEDAINKVVDAAHAKSSWVSWRDLVNEGYKWDLPMQIDVGGKTVGDAISAVLFQIDPTHKKLAFSLNGDRLEVNTVHEFTGHSLTATAVRLHENDSWFESIGRPDMQEIARVLTSEVDPPSWQLNGGRSGVIKAGPPNSGEFYVQQLTINFPKVQYVLQKLEWQWAVTQFAVRVFGVTLGMCILATFLERVARWRTRAELSRRGFCLQCGYDLRASPQRCPECGRPVDNGQKSVPGCESRDRASNI